LSLEEAFIELNWFVTSGGRRQKRKGPLKAELLALRKAESYQLTDQGPSFGFVTKLSQW